jgi:hypothetical protein
MAIEENFLILTTGEVKPFNPKGDTFTLKELQGGVGGSIELHRTRSGNHCFVINEDGKNEGLPVNHTATLLFNEMARFEDVLVGDVLYVQTKLID